MQTYRTQNYHFQQQLEMHHLTFLSKAQVIQPETDITIFKCILRLSILINIY